MKVERKCKITARERLTQDAVSMTLAVGDMLHSGDRPIRPGQFVHVKCGDGLLLRRPISISEWTESGGGAITIVFEVRGEGTAWLAERGLGDTLDVLGPLGNGFQIEREDRCLLVGGGIGVPPMLGCAQTSGGSATAILGFRTKDRAILLNRFEQECADVLVATDDGSLGYHGFVDALVRQELEKERRYKAVLACGPKPMLRNVAKVAEEFGVPCRVSMEERMGCGIGACLVCACDMKDGARKHVCKDGPVFNAEEVDWNA